MNLRFILLGLALSVSAWAQSPIKLEAGVSHFFIRQGNPESGQAPLAIDDPDKTAPFIAASMDLSDLFTLRLSYRYVSDLHTVATYGSPPSAPPPNTPVVVWGHYEDDLHLISFAPEFKWTLSPGWTWAIGPQVNWVASRGRISYSTTDPTVQLVAARGRNDDGFTLGGTTRVSYDLGERSALSLEYQFVDLEPSFNRESHILTASFQWKF